MATKNKKSGQAAIEALAYVGIFLFLTVFFSIFLLQQQASEMRERQFRLSTEVAGQIADAITLGSLAGPGFNATFRIPPQILGRGYAINLSSTGSLFITLLSPPDLFGGNNVTFYHTIGGRGNIYANPGAGDGVAMSGRGVDLYYVWFNSSSGQFNVYVAQNRDMYLG